MTPFEATFIAEIREVIGDELEVTACEQSRAVIVRSKEVDNISSSHVLLKVTEKYYLSPIKEMPWGFRYYVDRKTG